MIEVDAPLLEGARSMNKEALVKIFDLFSTPLFNYALRLCNDPLEADHVVGDVFARLLEQFSIGSGPSTNLRAYLYETTYHIIVDKARYARHETPLEDVDFLRNDGYSMIISLEDHVLFDTVILAIKRHLTEDQRHVIILRFLEGFSLNETAKIIGKEVYNVKVIQNRGVAKLRKALGYQVV